MKSIPTEMRKRILDDLNNGMTWAVTAEKWSISQSFIAKLKRQIRDTGSIEPIKPKTGPTPKLEPHYEFLQKIVAAPPRCHIGGTSRRLADRSQSSNRCQCVAQIEARL